MSARASSPTREAIERAEIGCLSDARGAGSPQGAGPSKTSRRGRALGCRACRRDPHTIPGLPCRPGRGDRASCATRGSGRIGRSAAGRALDPDAVSLAVAASVRHVDTDYDELLMSGVDRETGRQQVRERVEDVLSGWCATTH